jgi:hypothetical protein
LFEKYTVIIFLARNGRTHAVKFRPKNFFRLGRNFPKSANSSAEQWTKFAQIGRNSPEIFEGEPQLRGFAHFEQVSPKKNYCVVGKSEEKVGTYIYEQMNMCVYGLLWFSDMKLLVHSGIQAIPQYMDNGHYC